MLIVFSGVGEVNEIARLLMTDRFFVMRVALAGVNTVNANAEKSR